MSEAEWQVYAAEVERCQTAIRDTLLALKPAPDIGAATAACLRFASAMMADRKSPEAFAEQARAINVDVSDSCG